jgi:dipeptidyl aminopeptidase/acylaminoacyl peptidase
MRFVMVALATMFVAGAARAAPLEAYGKLPVMDQVSISPDGARIAFVQPVNGKQAVVIDQLNPLSPIASMPPTSQKVRGLTWADPDNLLITLSEEGNFYGVRKEWYFVLDADIRTRKITQLLKKIPGVPALTGAPEVRVRGGHTTVFAPTYFWRPSKDLNGDKIAVPALAAVDLATGKESFEQIAPSPQQRIRWILDDRGETIAMSMFDETTQVWGLALHRNGAWLPGYGGKEPSDHSDVVGLSPDGASLVLELYTEGRGYQFRPLTIADSKLGPAENAFGALSELVHDPMTDRVIGGRKIGLEPVYAFLDKKDQATWDRIVNLFPDEYVTFVSWSGDHDKVVVRVTGLRHGVVYELVDVKAGKAMGLGQPYDGIGPSDLADVRIATYPAKDGRPIKALLTLPNGRDLKNLPLIVLPHGGPADHDEAGFDWIAQALAARGYAVLQPQFRGSNSANWDLEAAGFGEWGRKMQTDLSDGVRALASQGFIDPKRVCIMGASYGGYAALAGVTLEQGVYRCAVSVAGISDLRKQIGGPKVDAEHSSTVRYWERFMGARNPQDPILDQLSPASHAAAASAPILLIHGKDDTVVQFEQSEIMERELKRAGKPVEFVALKNEDHWLSREATRTQMLDAAVAFLEKNNPPQ